MGEYITEKPLRSSAHQSRDHDVHAGNIIGTSSRQRLHYFLRSQLGCMTAHSQDAYASSVGRRLKDGLTAMLWKFQVFQKYEIVNLIKLRTKIKLSRAVEPRSSKFWMFWKATNLLLHLSTGFMGVVARYRAVPSTHRFQFLHIFFLEKNMYIA